MSMTPDTDTTESTDDTLVRARFARHVPGWDSLTDMQKRVILTAVRNPDAPLSEISDAAESTDSPARNVIWRYKSGAITDDGPDHAPVLNKGPAEFKELTVKQRAAIDFAARHPGYRDALTWYETAERLADELGVTMSPTAISNYDREHPDMVAKRRKWYRDLDPDRIEPLDDSEPSSDRSGPDPYPVRPDLVEAGFDDWLGLPDTNLDGLATADAAKRSADERRLEAIHETTQARLGENGDNGATADAGESDTIERDVGGRSYKGPAEGVNLAGGSEVSVFELASADAGEEIDAAFRDAIEEAGPFGEEAYRRDVSIDDRDALEDEIRRLRAVVSGQGSMIKALKDTIESLSVDVTVSVDAPELDEE